VNMVNELEFIRSTLDGHSSNTILANVWFQRYILEIDPGSGVVLRLYDLTDLCPDQLPPGENVLNGISLSADDDSRVLYVTGKQWSKVYKIRLL